MEIEQSPDVIHSPFKERGPIDDATASKILINGDIEIIGRMPWASNGTFLIDIKHQKKELQGVYKPSKGERPLHDFPKDIYKREVAAFELSKYLGWRLIPPTVIRDGPLGLGSIQLYIPCNYEEHYFTFHNEPKLEMELIRLATFDLLANNTDRKAGHVLIDKDNLLWAIDNSLCFHQEFKIRTVIWDFSGIEIPPKLISDLKDLIEQGPPESIWSLLNESELEALLQRAKSLVDNRYLPYDPTGRQVPWPLL